jgi:hypothetical protein
MNFQAIDVPTTNYIQDVTLRVESYSKAEQLVDKLRHDYCFECNHKDKCKYFNPEI